MANPWKKVVFAHECDDNGDCPACGEAFDECECIGPMQEGIEYKWLNGIMWGREKSNG